MTEPLMHSALGFLSPVDGEPEPRALPSLGAGGSFLAGPAALGGGWAELAHPPPPRGRKTHIRPGPGVPPGGGAAGRPAGPGRAGGPPPPPPRAALPALPTLPSEAQTLLPPGKWLPPGMGSGPLAAQGSVSGTAVFWPEFLPSPALDCSPQLASQMAAA